MKINFDINNWLSESGKKLKFPKEGIVRQAEESSGCRINATAGVTYDERGQLLTLPSLQAFFGHDSSILNYMPTLGLKELRQAWMKQLWLKNPALNKTANTTLPIATNGITQAIKIAGRLFLDEGDEVVLFDKFWDNYSLIFEMGLNARLRTLPMFNQDGLDLNKLKEIANEGINQKKLFVFNFPNNPTGYSPTIEEAQEIKEIMFHAAEKGNRLIVLCDDAYFGLVFKKGIQAESLFALLADLHPNIIAVKLDGITKEEFAWGLRLGFITIGGKGLNQNDLDLLENKIGGAIRSDTSNGCSTSQRATLQMLNSANHQDEKEKAGALLQRKFDVCQEILKQNKDRYGKHFETLPHNSGYFICLKLKKDNGEEVRVNLLNEFNIGVICLGDLLRVAFAAVPSENLTEVFEGIYAICENLAKKDV